MVKKKNINDELVTKGYLDFKLEGFKEDFKDEIYEKLTQFKSDIFSKLDDFISEVRAKRDDEAAHEASHFRVNDQLYGLDKRVTRLEKSPVH